MNGNNIIYFAKGHPDTIIPSKREEDAGYDIYARFDDPYITIAPSTTVQIPTDLYTSFDPSFVMILKERGSTGIKGIAQRSGVIDSGFRGSIVVPITNTTNDRTLVISKKQHAHFFYKPEFIVYPYEKAICQAILLPLPKMTVKEISVKKLKEIPSLRKEGIFDSTNSNRDVAAKSVNVINEVDEV